jgi:ferric-dicitrate binding protein FerR (iron transport regulator)
MGRGPTPFAGLQRLGLAAVAAVALIIATLVVRDHGQTKSAAAAPRVYRTANAQRATVTLTDGSTVMLGDASRLEVPADFGSGNRTVTLVGRGYFTAAHNSGAPLTVISGNVATRVLGTEFSVRKYADDAVARVYVSTGRVSVRATRSAEPNRRADTVLTANMLAQLGDSGDILVTANVSRNSALGWIAGRLVLTDAPITEAISEIERHYDLEISLADSALGVGDISAVFGDEPVSRVLDDLALALGARYTRSGPDGRIVTFLPSRRGVRRAPPSRTKITVTPEKSYGS